MHIEKAQTQVIIRSVCEDDVDILIPRSEKNKNESIFLHLLFYSCPIIVCGNISPYLQSTVVLQPHVTGWLAISTVNVTPWYLWLQCPRPVWVCLDC